MSGPSPHLKQQILEAARRTASPTRSAWLSRIVLVPLFALSLLVPLSFLHGVPNLASRPLPYVIVMLGGVLALSALSSWVLSQALFHPRPPRRARLVVVRAGLPLLLLAAALAHGLAPETWHGPVPQLGKHLFCPSALLITGGLVAAAALFALRGLDPVHPAGTAALIGTWAGSLALVAISLQCATLDPVHVGFGHLLPLVPLVMLARRLGRRWVAP